MKTWKVYFLVAQEVDFAFVHAYTPENAEVGLMVRFNRARVLRVVEVL